MPITRITRNLFERSESRNFPRATIQWCAGELPASIGNLANLQRLILHSNEIGGARDSLPELCMPSHTQRLTSLRAGAIPASIGNLTKLTCLALQGNALTGACSCMYVPHQHTKKPFPTQTPIFQSPMPIPHLGTFHPKHSLWTFSAPTGKASGT